jgi:preprotein translocase subunit YajC
MKGCTVSVPQQLIVAAAPAKSSGSTLGSLIPLLLLVIVAVLFLRSRKKQKLRAQTMRSSIAVGQRVMTTSGIIATIVDSDDESYSLEVADGVVITFVKAAVSKVLPEPLNPDYPGDETPAESADTVPDQANASSES